MDDQRGEFRVEPVRSKAVSRMVPVATFLVGIFLGAAVVKPWDLFFPAAPPATAQRPAVSASAGPSPSPSPSPPPAECAFAGGWRVFALGQPDILGGDGSTGTAGSSADPGRTDIGNPLRRWLEVDPLRTASGPGDQRIPFVTIVSDRIAGIGYCPPPDGNDGPPADARFEAWQLDSAGAPTALPLHRATLGTTSTIRVPVYIGADPPAVTMEHWPAGRYIFAVEGADLASYARWFGVEIRSPPGKLSS